MKQNKELGASHRNFKITVKKRHYSKFNKSFLPEALVHSKASSIHEATVVNSLIEYLKGLNYFPITCRNKTSMTHGLATISTQLMQEMDGTSLECQNKII